MRLPDLRYTKLNADIAEMARTLDRFAQDELSGTIHCDSAAMSELTRSMCNLQDRLVRKEPRHCERRLRR
jgi:hypothetical protein